MQTMYIQFNPHPQNKNISDCVKRAFVKALDKDYMEVQKMLNKIKNEVGAKKYNDNKVWREVVKRNKFTKISFPAVAGQPRMNGHMFAEQYPKGTYLLRMAKHLATVVDGVLYDSWDSRNKCVYNAFKIK